MSLQVEHLSYSYDRDPVLEDVSFQAETGQVLALLGPNGIGKTTLLKAFSGILDPQGGRTLVDGQDILRMSPAQRARLIAYVPQHANNLFPISVADTVLMGRQPFARFRPREEDKRKAFEILEQLELTPFAFRSIDALSGGERQRVLIARAIAQEPKLLLLDEPTSSMDIKNMLHTMELIVRLARERQITAVVSIHDLNLAAMYCDRFLFLKDHRVFACGSGEEALTAENLRQVYKVSTEITQVDGYAHIRLLKELPNDG